MDGDHYQYLPSPSLNPDILPHLNRPVDCFLFAVDGSVSTDRQSANMGSRHQNQTLPNPAIVPADRESARQSPAKALRSAQGRRPSSVANPTQQTAAARSESQRAATSAALRITYANNYYDTVQGLHQAKLRDASQKVASDQWKAVEEQQQTHQTADVFSGTMAMTTSNSASNESAYNFSLLPSPFFSFGFLSQEQLTALAAATAAVTTGSDQHSPLVPLPMFGDGSVIACPAANTEPDQLFNLTSNEEQWTNAATATAFDM